MTKRLVAGVLALALFLGPGVLTLAGQVRSRTRSTANTDTTRGMHVTLEGTLRGPSKKQFLLEVEHEQTLTIRITRKTVFQRGKDVVKLEAIPAGSRITLEATREFGEIVAARVLFNPPPAAK